MSIKKLGVLGVAALFLISGFSFVHALDFGDVLQWMHIKGLTKYNTVEEFRGDDNITRGESSKFITKYAEILGLAKTYTQCTFSDIASYDHTLTPYIAEVCAYGLIKGSEGRYMPQGKLTEAQAATIVIRSLKGFQDETKSPWYIDYYNEAKALGMITTETVAGVNSTNITREKLGKRLFIADHGRTLGEAPANVGVSMAITKSDGTKTDVSGAIGVEIDREGLINGFRTYDDQNVATALAQGQQVVLYFQADRCPLCQALNQNLEENASLIPDTLAIFEIDYTKDTQLVKDRNITSQHTLVYLNASGSEMYRNIKKEVTLEEVIKTITTGNSKEDTSIPSI